jgi:hypothetical protein
MRQMCELSAIAKFAFYSFNSEIALVNFWGRTSRFYVETLIIYKLSYKEILHIMIFIDNIKVNVQ